MRLAFLLAKKASDVRQGLPCEAISRKIASLKIAIRHYRDR